MPPVEPPTGEGPGTLAVRRMSGLEPGRDIAFWNAVLLLCIFECVVCLCCVIRCVLFVVPY